MKKIKHILLVCLVAILVGKSYASDPEPRTKQIVIKKEQLLDILSAIRNPETEEALNEYFSNVFPTASKHGFKIDGSFVTIAPPSMGNYNPQFIALMSWPNPSSRDQFQSEAGNLPYNYKAARKKIWSVFNLTFYDNLEKDITFTVREDKIYVITTYWVDDMDAFTKSKQQAAPKMESAGGKMMVLLGKGQSPIEYMYEPDVVSITEWESVEAFEAFIGDNNHNTAENGIKNVNQWKTKFLFDN